MLKERSFDIPVLIGGAPVNSRHAGYVAMCGQDDTNNILNNILKFHLLLLNNILTTYSN